MKLDFWGEYKYPFVSILYTWRKLLTMPSYKKTNEHATVFGWQADALLFFISDSMMCVYVCVYLGQAAQRSQSYSI